MSLSVRKVCACDVDGESERYYNRVLLEPDSFIVFAPDVPEEEGHYPAPFDKERLGFFRDIGRAAGSKSIGMGLDRLPPGERTSFTHAHSHEEELIYVLEGEVHVRLIEPGKDVAVLAALNCRAGGTGDDARGESLEGWLLAEMTIMARRTMLTDAGVDYAADVKSARSVSGSKGRATGRMHALGQPAVERGPKAAP